MGKRDGSQATQRREKHYPKKNNKGPSPQKSVFREASTPDKQTKRKHQQDDPAAIPVSKRQRPSSPKSADKFGSKPADIAEPRNELWDEIQALGGDEEDLALIRDVGSDSEGNVAAKGASVVDPVLQHELKALAAELGLDEFHGDTGNGDHNGAASSSADPNDDAEVQTQPSPADMTAADGPEGGEHPSSPLKDSGLKKQFKFEPRADWHAIQLSRLPLPLSNDTSRHTNAIQSLKSHAWTLLEQDAEVYGKSVLAASSHKFLSTIMASGTLSDKVSALTLAVQESPVHNVKAFDALMNLASKRNRGQAIGALGALIDLLGPGLILPPDRRLHTFGSQPGLLGILESQSIYRWNLGQGLPVNLTDAHLISWAYEDWLKSNYFRIIQFLEVWCGDEIEYSRTRSLDFVYALLKDKPEQEQNLLRLLVNKLGDRSRKISSRASYLLLQLQNAHPGMKIVVIRAIEQEVLLRPGQGNRAIYYAIGTLNQTILSKRDPPTAGTLLRIYFEIFVTLLKGPVLGRDEPDQEQPSHTRGTSKVIPAQHASNHTAERDAVEKLVSAVLTGINRAAPFVGATDPMLESHINTLFRIAHSANFNTSMQALILIQQLSATRHIAIDRFYRTLYESLLDPRLTTSSKQAMYLNLLLRSLKADVDTRRVKAFMKRMLQILGLHQPPFACGILYVIFELRQRFPDLRTLLEEPEDIDKPARTHVTTVNGQSPTIGTSALEYDGRKRDPEHSNAQHSCLWEIVPFIDHFHPSVSVFAHGVLSNNGEGIQKPELENQSLIRFLDKFVYRNPKASDSSSRGVSIMQPIGKRAVSATNTVNHPSFWNKKLEQVSDDEAFFHHYFQASGKPSQVQAKGKRVEPVGESDAEDEDEIWKALTASHPDGPIDDSDESDFGFDDFDDSDEGEAELPDPSLGPGEDNDDIEGSTSEDGYSEGVELLGAADVDSGGDGEEGTGEKGPESRSSRRKRLKALPTFASADEYAELLAQEDQLT